MRPRPWLLMTLAVAATFAAVASTVVVTLPTSVAPSPPPLIGGDEQAATLAALKAPKRSRPVIAVVGSNEGTETTDFLVPYGVLQRADLGTVVALGTHDGPISLMPALKIVPHASTASFDVQYPDGADFVIVPAMHNDDDPATVAWVRGQAAKGAILVGICAGAKVLGNAGLLDGRAATTHWYELAGVRGDHPAMRYVADRRFVVDRGVATTTGVTASIPMSLTLVEAIAGHKRAAEVASDLGIDSWDARHDSGAFRATQDFFVAAIGNTLAFWDHEQLGIELKPGIDEVALALTADAWSRTYRSGALAVATDTGAVIARGGIGILPDRVASDAKLDFMLPAVASEHPARALDTALNDIANRYGRRTMAFVALQLEYFRAVDPH